MNMKSPVLLETDEVTSLEGQLASSKVRHGPCDQALEPVMQRHHIQRQAYLRGAFVGNHIHKALKRDVAHALTHAAVNVVEQRCPSLLQEATDSAER